jgi:hypothetical protein
VFADLWEEAYIKMLKTVQDSKRVPNPLITPEVEALLQITKFTNYDI